MLWGCFAWRGFDCPVEDSHGWGTRCWCVIRAITLIEVRWWPDHIPPTNSPGRSWEAVEPLGEQTIWQVNPQIGSRTALVGNKQACKHWRYTSLKLCPLNEWLTDQCYYAKKTNPNHMALGCKLRSAEQVNLDNRFLIVQLQFSLNN